jgi:hypothetical protein
MSSQNPRYIRLIESLAHISRIFRENEMNLLYITGNVVGRNIAANLQQNTFIDNQRRLLNELKSSCENYFPYK